MEAFYYTTVSSEASPSIHSMKEFDKPVQRNLFDYEVT